MDFGCNISIQIKNKARDIQIEFHFIKKKSGLERQAGLYIRIKTKIN
jgi:hypothetical protein